MQALVDEFKMDIMSRDFVSHNQHLAHYLMLHIHRLCVFDLLLYSYVCVCVLDDVERKDPISLCCSKQWSGVSKANGVRVLGRP